MVKAPTGLLKKPTILPALSLKNSVQDLSVSFKVSVEVIGFDSHCNSAALAESAKLFQCLEASFVPLALLAIFRSGLAVGLFRGTKLLLRCAVYPLKDNAVVGEAKKDAALLVLWLNDVDGFSLVG